MRISLVALVIAGPLFASPLEKSVDAYLQPFVKSGDFSGTVLVARGDRILLEKSYGKADFELQAPFTPDSRFRIASITKTFTAAAIEILAERGALSYDDHLAKWAPTFPSADVITVRNLLLHASGVPNPDSSPRTRVPLASAVEALGKKQLLFQPGTGSRYSNGGYLLLAYIVEKTSGKSWEEFLAAEIFKPLRLSSMQSDTEAIVTGRVSGYAPGPGVPPLTNVDANISGAIGSGSLLASARDLYRWGRAVRDETLVKRTKLEYSYGWGDRKYFGRDAIEQSGLTPGFTSYLAVYPSEDLYVVVLSNIQTGLFNRSGKDIAAIVLGEKIEPVQIPAPATVKMSDNERRAFLGRYTHEKIGTFSITEDAGALYLRWGNSEERKYLMPVSSTSLFNREEFSWLERKPESSDEVSIRWGKEPQIFRRAAN